MIGGLTLRGVVKSFGTVTALNDVELDIGAGRLTALVGPSGCGKSTLLSIIAGLLESDHGTVELDGTGLDDVPAERRPVGLVFQKPLLFPNLDVADNVAFGLRMHRVPREQQRRRVVDMLRLVQLDDLATRRVGELSGGQEQRVALARALVLEPRLLLLDEPFSQLDAGLRVEMRQLVRRLHDERGLTTLFVTHDHAEAVEIADDIALLLDGSVAGHAEPEVFYRRPPSLAAARFFRTGNELAGEVREGRFRAGPISTDTEAADGPAVLVIRPEAVRIDGEVPTTVTAARFAGTHLVLELTLAGGGELTAHVPVGSPVRVGAELGVRLPAEACAVFPDGAR